jgi:hypothetical protein
LSKIKEMKKIFILVSLVVLLASCDRNAFTINGTVEKGYKIGDTVYLQYIDNGRIVTLGREAVNNGQFKIKGSSEKPHLCYLSSIVGGKVHTNAEVYVEPGEIELSLGIKRNKVAGTPLNINLQEYKDSIDILDIMFKQYYDKSKHKFLSQKAAEEADKAMKVLSIVRSQYVERFLEKNIDNEVSSYILSKNIETLDPEKGAKLIARMPAELKVDTLVRHIERTFLNKIATAEGKIFTDFKAITNDSKRVQFSDYVAKGKIVVFNIWSSNSNRAKDEIALFRAFADANKEKVLCVSFAVDTDAAKWDKTIKENNMWWPQISDLQGWNSRTIFSYGINLYPYNIVFDAEGRIYRRAVAFENLQSVVDEIMK